MRANFPIYRLPVALTVGLSGLMGMQDLFLRQGLFHSLSLVTYFNGDLDISFNRDLHIS